MSSCTKIGSIFLEFIRKDVTKADKEEDAKLKHVNSFDPQDIDLLFYLTGQEVSVVQGFSDVGDESTEFDFITLTGKLTSGAPFTLKLRTQGGNQSPLTSARVSLSNGEVHHVEVKDQESDRQEEESSPEFEKLKENSKANLEDVAKVIRFLQCADESLEEKKSINMKYLTKDMVPVLTIGTGTFLHTGLTTPVNKTKGMALIGIWSKDKKDREKEIFNEVVRMGEPMEFFESYDELMGYKSSTDYPAVFYTLSIPGERKEQEMIDSLKAGYWVLAEKPAFANSDDAKKFRGKINDEMNSRLIFGWHYQHHLVFQKIWEDVEKGTFGKIKHIKTYFSIPKLLDGSRIFEPSQGGVGLDVFSYNLHCTLRLNGFEHSYEVTESNIKSAEDLDPENEDLKKIDFVMDTKLKFGNGVTAELSATFEHTTVHRATAEIEFEDGTKVLYKAFQNVQNLAGTGLDPVVIQKPGEAKWEGFLSDDVKKEKGFNMDTYDHQIEFMMRLAKGEEKYDVKEDVGGLCIEKNVKLQEIMDAIFLKGGFEKKTGAKSKEIPLKRD